MLVVGLIKKCWLVFCLRAFQFSGRGERGNYTTCGICAESRRSNKRFTWLPVDSSISLGRSFDWPI